MKCSLRSTVVLVLLAVIGFRLVTIYTMAGDPSRAQQVSRRAVHPADVRAARVGHAQVRVVRDLAAVPAFDPRPISAAPRPVLSDRRLTSRLVSTFPSHWSSTHLTI
jgi:hypothetical protein